MVVKFELQYFPGIIIDAEESGVDVVVIGQVPYLPKIVKHIKKTTSSRNCLTLLVSTKFRHLSCMRES